jgi:hypothetical protein
MELRISFFFSFWFWEGHGKIMKVTRRDIDIHIDAKRGNQTRGGKRKNFILSFFVSILISSLGVDDSIHIRFFYRSATALKPIKRGQKVRGRGTSSAG